MIPWLLAAGAELEARNEDRATAFLVACNNGQLECAAALVEAGCDATATVARGQTGLMVAVHIGHTAMIPWLLAGAGTLRCG